MASIFEEWNGAGNSPQNFASGSIGIEEAYGAEGCDFANDKDDPSAMFTIQRVPIPTTRKAGKGKTSEPIVIHTMAESNNVLVIATSGKTIVRWNIKETPEDIELPFKEDKVHKIFIDPTGSHVVITTVASDCYYLHASKSKAILLKKLCDCHIESIAWNRLEGNATSTGSILIGTRNGLILETALEGREKYVKSVFSLQQNMPICSLQLEHFPESGTPKYFVMAATANPSRYFQFVGGPNFETLFAAYRDLDRQNCTELPGDMNYTELRFFAKPTEEQASLFALLTGFGTYCGHLAFRDQQPGEPVTMDTKEFHHTIAPLSIALTEFHLLSLYPRKLVVSNLLNSETVYERKSPVDIKGLCCDVNGLIWVFGDRDVFVVSPHDEDRDAWHLYLQNAKEGAWEDFEKALALCKDAESREEVRRAQAEFYFERGEYLRAAEFYAMTELSLEEISLQLLEKKARPALKRYLLAKLRALEGKKKAQRTLLCTWLTEIYLDAINAMSTATEDEEEAKQSMLLEFRDFLTTYTHDVDIATTYALLSSHGCVEDVLFFARLIEDFDRVITHHIQREDIISAIFVLQEVPIEKAELLYYKFAPQMLLLAPKETVDAWMSVKFLSPCRLIPALVRYEQFRRREEEKGGEELGPNEAIRYLEYQIKEISNTDPAIHNYLLSLYAMQESDEELMNFLDYFSDDYIYDVKYALRICIQEKKPKACVYIYSLLHLYEESVKLALKVDLELAKYCADKPEDEETKKKLWLIITKFVIENNNDIGAAIHLLEECSLLRIDDLLPFFPDFVVIDKFKDHIIKSLEDYNSRIGELKEEMESYTSSAEVIRKEIQDLKARHGEIGGSQVCELCEQIVLSRSFYLFPCSHVFHADCLLSEMEKHLASSEKAKLKQLQEDLRKLNHASLSSNEQEAKDKLQSDVDKIIASECPLCGSVMINSINKPFVSKEEEEALMWAI